MLRSLFRLSLLTAVIGLVLAPAAAQPPASGRKIDDAERKAVIDGVLEKVEANYVFPDVGKKMAEAVRARQAKKEYDSITDGKELAETLTKHLREVSKDLHLGVRFFSEPVPMDTGRPSPEEMKKRQEQLALRNYGFKKVERLGGGGVGLLELEGFMRAEDIGETAAAAMTFLANSEAVIVDLRRNGGGDPAAV